jgi:hypothetical protein
MKIHVSDLSGSALDWAVAYGLNGEKVFFEAFGSRMLGRSIIKETLNGEIRPSTDWSQCGPLIDKYNIDLCCEWEEMHCATMNTVDGNSIAVDWMEDDDAFFYGSTKLQAACRCIVGHNLGEYVDIPDELLEVE